MKALLEQTDRRLVTVGRLFYEHQLNKTDIADRLNISVTHVNRLLKEAARRGIVEISIRAPRFEDLEMNLRERYRLRDVRVVAAATDENSTRSELGAAAARYFDERVHDGARVGLGSGRTLFEMASALSERPLSIELFPLAVFAEQTSQVSGVDSNTVVNILWFKTRPGSTAQRCTLYFPGDDVSALQEHVRSLTDTSHVRALRARIAQLDYYFLSCAGLRSDSQLVALAKTNERSLDDFKASGIIGDIVLNTIDANGEYCPSGVEAVLFNIGYDDLLAAAKSEEKTVVLIAGGRPKAPVIEAALRGRLLNVLITDSDTAQILLN